MKLFAISILILLTEIASAQQPAADWENPQVFEKNQVEPHAMLVPFTSKPEALQNQPDDSPNYLSLNGTWKFKWFETPDLAPAKFFATVFDVSDWQDIPVPSNWQMQGFGHAKFRNIRLTFHSDPPYVPDDYNPTGCYKRTFIVPDEWQGREIFLRFEGVKSASLVWLNGREVGYNEGGFEPAEYRVTPFIHQGENDIAVKVLRYSDGSYIENQDMWRLSGIYRDVRLYATPKTHLQDYYITTDLDSSYKDARLSVEAEIINHSSETVDDISLRIDLLDENRARVYGTAITSEKISIAAGAYGTVQIAEHVDDPAKWSAEKPNLYTLTFELLSGDKVIEAYSKRIGFREVEIIDGAICVNGVPVKFNGVNSHMHHPEHGQSVPVATMEQDLKLMKQYNINLVRTSHYPPSPEYLGLADVYGIYVVDEVNDECHRNIHLSGEPEWRAAFVNRMRKMVKRDRNHPSVIFWSAGNEAGWGENIKAVIEEGKRLDPGRPWMYGGNRFYIPFEDITGPRYWIPLDLKRLAENKVLAPDDRRPSFMDEYLAATGNSIGGLDEYWELIHQYPRLSGGAIWDWVSPGINAPIRTAADASSHHNDGVLMGPAKLSAGKTGQAIDLSGHDDWVEFYNSPSLDIGGPELTIDFMVYPRSLDDPNTFIAKSSHQYGILQNHPDSLTFTVYTDEQNSASAAVPADWYEKWHRVTGIKNDSTMILYIDLQKAAERKAGGDIQTTPYPLCIGRDSEKHDQGEFEGRLCNAMIDDVRIYDKAIPVSALRSDMNASENPVLSIDFETVSDKGNFFFTGLGGRRYGIVWPDRAIQPEIHQLKKSAQPVHFAPVDLTVGKITIGNRFNFTNLNELNAVWQLKANGDVLQHGDLWLDIPPHKKAEIRIPFKAPQLKPGTEYWLEIFIKLPEATRWAGKGHVVAREQFKLPYETAAAQTMSDPGTAISTTETEKEIIVSGRDFEYVFDKKSGALTAMEYLEHQLIEQGPLLNVWRAPLSNDFDPWGSWHFRNDQNKPGLNYGILNQWLSIGIDRLTHELQSIRVEQMMEKEVRIETRIFSFTASGQSAFESLFDYRIAGDGEIRMHHKIIPHGPMPEHLPKSGVQLQIPEEFNLLKWYGRGPFENYPDRKTAAFIAVYESSVEQQVVPYLMPQDYGNKTDIRWLTVKNQQGIGLMVRGDELLNFSAQMYSTDNLSRAQHLYQLKDADAITLNIDYEVSGVGDTATRTQMKYRVFPEVLERTIFIRPFQDNEYMHPNKEME